MTGGVAVILGATGRNFAAGMSGGVVYVLDENHDLYTRLNKTGLLMSTLSEREDIDRLRDLLTRHEKETGSEKARKILADFDHYIPAFKKIIPKDYAKMVDAIAALEAQGKSRSDAEIEAFFRAVNH